MCTRECALMRCAEGVLMGSVDDVLTACRRGCVVGLHRGRVDSLYERVC